jgi:hypothetical protein
MLQHVSKSQQNRMNGHENARLKPKGRVAMVSGSPQSVIFPLQLSLPAGAPPASSRTQSACRLTTIP